jgi:GNAT superfamily N-acetyltransferase
MTLRVQRLSGAAIKPYIPDLARLRMKVFRDYPYLYDGDAAHESQYLQGYAESPESLMVIAWDDDKVVGAATAMPLKNAPEEVQRPFLAQDFHLDEIFYLGESVLQQPYRGQGIGGKFFEEREAHAREMQFNYAVFCAVERPLIHPGRPIDYVPLDKFWHQRGYQKRAELYTAFTWKQIDEAKASEKPMIFWMKRFR